MKTWLAVVSIIFLLSLAGATASRAQFPSNSTSTPIPGVGHDYIQLFNETVNPANGSVSLRLGIPIPPGRQLTIPFAFTYDSNGVYNPYNNGVSGSVFIVSSTSPTFVSVPPPFTNGWGNTIPTMSNSVFVDPHTGPKGENSCNFGMGFVFTDPNGGRNSLGMTWTNTSEDGCTGLGPGLNAGANALYSSSITNGSLVVSSRDGTVYSFVNQATWNNVNSGVLPASIEDRNGNITTFTSKNTQSNFSETDSTGRQALSVAYSPGTQLTSSVSISGLSSAYVVTWETLTPKFGLNVTPLSSPGSSSCGTVWSYSNLEETAFNVVKSIALPNGQQYQFFYDTTYGLLSKIVYPSGGSITYTWGTNPQSEAVGYDWGTNFCSSIYDWPALKTRVVSFDGVNPAQTQSFAYQTARSSGLGIWTSKQTTVTTTDNIAGGTYTTSYTYAPINVPPIPDSPPVFAGQIPVEQTVVYNGTSGSTLRTVAKAWADQFTLDSVATTLDNGETSKIVYPGGAVGNIFSEKDEYDFGQSSPTRITKNTYQTFGNSPVFSNFPDITDRPCKTVTYDGTGVNVFAETDYLYDGGSSACGAAGSASTASATVSLTTHDGTNYAPTSSTPRGNVTSIVRKCLQSGSACAGGSPTTKFTYDETGQVVSMTDPCGNVACGDMTGAGHTTTYSYADSYSSCNGAPLPTGNTNAYLTLITNPLGQTDRYCYGYNDGQLRGATDKNGQATLYTYASTDPLDRLTETSYPDGGQTTLTYNDSVPSISTSKLIASGRSFTTNTVMDGMGHTIESEVTSDPNGTAYAVTKYDGMGLPYLAYNPTRCSTPTTNCGESTWGFSTTTYDALGRTSKVLEQDNSAVTTVYSGNCITVTDEMGISRESCADGLGRLTQVIESPSGLAYQTIYQYNTLNDLTNVSQGGSRQRTFAYNSLSQLTSSVDPEVNSLSGTSAVSYTYDANGNVATRSDVRPARVTNSYDVLNRVTGMTYSNGDPSVSYQYDQTGCSGPSPCYNVGRRTAATHGGSSESFSYDSMGRITGQHAQTNNVPETTSLSYDLNGDRTSLTYPSGRALTYLYDAAARLTTVFDSANQIKYGEEASYSPSGGLRILNNSSVYTTTWIYNSRLQPCWIYTSVFPSTPLPVTDACTATFKTGTVLDLKYNFNLGNDNGNVYGITNNRDTTRSQAFTYDQLNRLLTAQTPAPCGSNCWSQTFSYDQWANLRSVAAAGTAPALTALTFNSNNHISSPASFTYDAVGNLTADATSAYTWYTDGSLKTGGGVTYLYDADGNRVEKSNGKIYWYGPGGEILDESDLSGNMTDEYVYFGEERIAHRVVSSNSIFYYVADTLGTSRALGTSTGTLCYDADFYPFGGERPYISTCIQNYKFTGKERDVETNNDDFGARYYSSVVGHFMSPDPVGGHQEDPQTLNKYLYVRDNPVTLTDPTGLDFYIGCNTADHSGCTQVQIDPNKTSKTWVRAGGDGNAMIVTSDSIRSGENSATVSPAGVQLTAGSTTGQGVYFDNPASHSTDSNGNDVNNNPISLQGDTSKGFGGFTFNINGNCGGTCLSSGSFQYAGTPEQARAALRAAGSWDYGLWDVLNSTAFGHHPYTDQFRFGGGPSPHFSVPWDFLMSKLPATNPRSTVPATGDFHVDPTVGTAHAACANIPGVSCAQ